MSSFNFEESYWKNNHKLKFFLSDEEIDKLSFENFEQFRDFILNLQKQREEKLILLKGQKFCDDLQFPKHSQLRIIKPNDIICANLCYDRLNIYLDENEIIVNVDFG